MPELKRFKIIFRTYCYCDAIVVAENWEAAKALFLETPYEEQRDAPADQPHIESNGWVREEVWFGDDGADVVDVDPLE